MRKLLFFSVSVALCALLISCVPSTQNRQTTENQQTVENRQVVERPRPLTELESILKEIELVSYEFDFLREGRFYFPRLTMEWRNISGQTFPSNKRMHVTITVINNETGQELEIIGTLTGFLNSGSPFMPNTIRTVRISTVTGGNIRFIGENFSNLSFHIFINRNHYKEIRFSIEEAWSNTYRI